MRALALCLLLAAAAAAQFVPTPVDFLAVALNATATVAYWQQCAFSPTSATADLDTILNYQCTGTRLLVACIDSSGQFAVAAAAPRASWLTAGTVVANTYPLPASFTVANTSAVLSAGASVPALCTAASGDAVCFPRVGASLAAGAYCGPALGFVVSADVYRAFYTNPCEGAAVNASCASVAGACGLNATCGAGGTCDAAPKLPHPPTCVADFSCDPATGAVAATYLDAGAACPYNNSCVAGAACAANHSCGPAILHTCPFLGRCFGDGACDLDTQACTYTPAPNGTHCSFATACHGEGMCLGNGTCATEPTPPTPATCGVPVACSDFLGGWTHTAAPNGTACVSTNKCINDTYCSGAGVGQPSCVGTPIVCPPQTCRGPAYCVNATGACASAPLAQGTPCDDGDPCTQGTTCGLVATCGGGVPALFCPPSPPACMAYARTALNATTCVCTLVPVADNTTCDDGDICTTGDQCGAGVCAGAAVTCGGDDCNFPLGVCSPATGCYNPRPDGLPCNSTCMANGNCADGLCLGGTFDAANPSCVPGAARRVSAALDAWLDDDLLGGAGQARPPARGAAAGALAARLPLGLSDGAGPDRNGRVPAA